MLLRRESTYRILLIGPLPKMATPFVLDRPSPSCSALKYPSSTILLSGGRGTTVRNCNRPICQSPLCLSLNFQPWKRHRSSSARVSFRDAHPPGIARSANKGKDELVTEYAGRVASFRRSHVGFIPYIYICDLGVCCTLAFVSGVLVAHCSRWWRVWRQWIRFWGQRWGWQWRRAKWW